MKRNFGEYSPDLAMAFVKAEETLRLKAYKCPKGVWTIGWGHTGGIKEGDTCTREQAEAWIRSDLQSAQTGLARVINVPVSAKQFIALLSLAFNMGAQGVVDKCPKMLRALNAGDYETAADEFLDVTNGGLAGLVARRRREAELMRQG
ncbi:lysozyme [Sutterella wadsworthensis]|jgi:lysozyme|uniref:lysozyme n=1 Tax=Sutterella wadsworthensis TaxID=40545 RepID=UPI0013F5F318|nr:lysozyme [Sutterella wadsworthensis]